ncbi:hypothetical protein B0O80DRAFT_420870 [Mortierella sp. GBAus27b]|nr:hypothetical protein B0O80DRAFT_420870 [Mortierella sp. GBAus27b]
MSDWEVDYAYSTQCSAVAINTYAMLDDRPCKVTEISSSDGKITLAGRDLFTGDNHKQNFGSDWRVTVPNVTREVGQLVGISKDGMMTLTIRNVGNVKVRLPEGDMGTEIRAKFDPDSDKTKVMGTIFRYNGEAAVVSFKLDRIEKSHK